MPERPIYDGFSKTCLLDPEQLRDRTDVLFTEETRVVDDAGAFNGHESWAGTVAVGVVNDGRVLLVNAPEGWSLPTSPVRAGDDWAAVARRWVAQKTGLAVSIERPERVTRTSYRLAGSEYRQTTGYNVVFRALPETPDAPAATETPMDHLNAKRASDDGAGRSPPGNRTKSDGGNEWDAEWFDCVPDDVAEREGDHSDIEWFVDG